MCGIVDEYNIRLSPGTWYLLHVVIYDTKKSMWAGHREFRGLRRVHRRFSGIVEGYRIQHYVGQQWRTSPEIATLRLCVESLTVGVLSHEAFHVALRWHEVRNGPMLHLSSARNEVSQHEESAAWVAGHVVNRVVRRANSRKYSQAQRRR